MEQKEFERLILDMVREVSGMASTLNRMREDIHDIGQRMRKLEMEREKTKGGMAVLIAMCTAAGGLGAIVARYWGNY